MTPEYQNMSRVPLAEGTKGLCKIEGHQRIPHQCYLSTIECRIIDYRFSP